MQTIRNWRQPYVQVQLNSPESLRVETGLNLEMDAIKKKLATIFVNLTTLFTDPTELIGECSCRDRAESGHGRYQPGIGNNLY